MNYLPKMPLLFLHFPNKLISSGTAFCPLAVFFATFRDPKKVFDRNTKFLQRERSAILPENHIYDYLKEEVGLTLADRILDIKKEMIDGLDLGCGKGLMSKHISDTNLKRLCMAEFSPRLLEASAFPQGMEVTKRTIDEENQLPFDSESLDIVLSNLNLHWVNDLPSCLKEIYRILRNDGAFLASIFGSDTLYQLRSSFILGELEREGGFASHVSPFIEMQDIAGLLNQAGFSLLTIDTDEITINYPSLFELMVDLKGMAENNASVSRKLHLHRDTLFAAAAIYQEMYGNSNSIPATFQIIYMIGWRPDPSKPVAQAERGSAQVSLKDISKLNKMIKEHGMEGRLKFIHEKDKSDNSNGDASGR